MADKKDRKAIYRVLLWHKTPKALCVTKDENKSLKDYSQDEKFWLPKSMVTDVEGDVPRVRERKA